MNLNAAFYKQIHSVEKTKISLCRQLEVRICTNREFSVWLF